jgi:heme exporter protein B
MRAAATLLRRELSLAWGGGGGPLMSLAFYACAASLLPLAAGPDLRQLAGVATGSAFLALALASLLSLERLFERDYEDGALDLLSIGPLPLEAVCAIKCLAQWIAGGAPLALMAPVVAGALGAEPRLAGITLAAALVGGLGFAFVGGVGARRGGLLIAVIVLPLFAPPVIFGAGAIESLAAGLDWAPPFAFLGAYSLAAIGLGPLAMAAACRNASS